MHKIGIDTATANGASEFTEGNPAGGVAATDVKGPWLNSVQRELVNVVEGAGFVLSGVDDTQVRQAIQKMVADAGKAITIAGAVFAAGVVTSDTVRWDSAAGNFAKAMADGSANNLAVGFADLTNAKVYVYGETPAIFAGLTPGARYYLGAAGGLSTVAPADIVIVGIAKSATTMFVDIDEGIAELLGTRNLWTKAQDVAQVALADAANIATNASLSNVFLVTLAGNRTLDNPTNLVAGQRITWNINQDATGGRTLAYGSLFKFPNNIVPELSVVANAIDTLTGVYDGTIIRAIMQSVPVYGQIKFPATQNASTNANTLDDYEEGAWTPIVGGTATYLSQQGRYTKIGRVLTISFRLEINAIGTGSTNVISGVPFTALGESAVSVRAQASITAIVSISGTVAFGAAINLFSRTAASIGDAANAIFGANSLVIGGGSYDVS